MFSPWSLGWKPGGSMEARRAESLSVYGTCRVRVSPLSQEKLELSETNVPELLWARRGCTTVAQLLDAGGYAQVSHDCAVGLRSKTRA
jgi:hypothetical protein